MLFPNDHFVKIKKYKASFIFKKHKIYNNITRAFQRIFSAYFEIIFWVGAILALLICDPTGNTHYSLCLFKNLGFNYCPGCGLGHSISWLLHGNLIASFKAHPLGIPALSIILFRIITLAKYNLSTTQFNQHGIHKRS